MPHIDKYQFGFFVVDGKEYDHDIRIINNVIDTWHDHSLSLEDIKDAINIKPNTIIIGTGSLRVMQVSDGIRDAISKAGIKLRL